MGHLSCCSTVMKYILFLFNIVFFITGAAIVGVGIWLKVDPAVQNYLQVISINEGSQLMDVTLYVLIGVGAFIFLVGFLGCCGACRESTCMLGLYAALLVLVLILEIAVAVLAVVNKGWLGEELKHSMEKQVNNMTHNNKDPTAILWNTIQFNLKCCGAIDYNDYADYGKNNASYPIPPTCCKMDTLDIAKPSMQYYSQCVEEFKAKKPNGTLHPEGCYKALPAWIQKHANILMGVGFGIALIQLLGIIFACWVRKSIITSTSLHPYRKDVNGCLGTTPAIWDIETMNPLLECLCLSDVT